MSNESACRASVILLDAFALRVCWGAWLTTGVSPTWGRASSRSMTSTPRRSSLRTGPAWWWKRRQPGGRRRGRHHERQRWQRSRRQRWPRHNISAAKRYAACGAATCAGPVGCGNPPTSGRARRNAGFGDRRPRARVNRDRGARCRPRVRAPLHNGSVPPALAASGATTSPTPPLPVVPKYVVHPGLLGGWGVSKPPRSQDVTG
jgi:hypothetical protein